MMKTSLLFFALTTMLVATGAQAADTVNAQGKVLSVQKFKVSNDLTVDLPTTLMPDGTVCVRYVAQATQTYFHNKESSLDATTSSVCGKPSMGVDHGQPENLVALQTVTSDGVSIQVPTLRSW